MQKFDFTLHQERESPAHWEGYGAYMEGVHYSDCRFARGTRSREDWMVGWNRALRDGKQHPKGLLTSKTVLAAIGIVVIGLLAIWQKALIANNPELAGLLGVGAGYIMVVLRLITDTPIKLPGEKK